MARYIDADILIKNGWRLERHAPSGAVIVEMSIADVPTADVAEVRHGEWIPIIIQDNYLDPPYCDTLKCSECEQEVDVSFGNAKYCFNCGARMDGGEKK
jgi:hypothetical protein